MKNLNRIPLWLCLGLLLFAGIVEAQPVLRNNLTTNNVAVAPADGYFMVSSNSLPVWGQAVPLLFSSNAYTTNLTVNNTFVTSNAFVTNLTVQNITNLLEFHGKTEFITNLSVNFITNTTAYITNLFATIITNNTFYSSNAFITNLTVVNLTNQFQTNIFVDNFFTNLTVTNLTVNFLTNINQFFSSNAFITNLTVNNITNVNLISSNAYITNLNTTNLFATFITNQNFFSSNAFITNLTVQTITNNTFFSSNAFITNLTVQNFFNLTSSIGNLTVTNGITNLSLTPLTVLEADANRRITSIPNAVGVLSNNGAGAITYAPIATLITNNVFNTFNTTNLFTTNLTVQTITNVTLISSNAFITNLTVNNLITTNLIVTNIFTTNLTATTITNNTFVSSNSFITNLTVNNFFNLTSSIGNLTVTNGITNLSLTPNTSLRADANKRITSVPNAIGVLTNDGIGGLSFIPVETLITNNTFNTLITTNLFTTNLTVQNITNLTLVTSNAFFTNITVNNLTVITNLFSSNAFFTNLTVNVITNTTFISSNAFITNLTVNNLVSSNAFFTNVFVTSNAYTPHIIAIDATFTNAASGQILVFDAQSNKVWDIEGDSGGGSITYLNGGSWTTNSLKIPTNVFAASLTATNAITNFGTYWGNGYGITNVQQKNLISPTNGVASANTLDFSVTEATTNAAGAIGFSAISNFNPTNYNWAIRHILANGADRNVTFPAGWKSDIGTGATYVATNGTVLDLLFEMQLNVYSNVSSKWQY